MEKTNLEQKIRTGEVGKFRLGMSVNDPMLRLLYSGMPNDRVFTLAPAYDADLDYTFEAFKVPTIYYRKGNEQISVFGFPFRVGNVSPDEIVLQYLG